MKFLELIKLNFPDWPFVLMGIILSAIVGCLFPLMSILFSELLEVGVAYTHVAYITHTHTVLPTFLHIEE